jgi:hypothetical protein
MTTKATEALVDLALACGWTRYTEVDGPKGDDVPPEGTELLGQTDAEDSTWGRLDDDGEILVAPYAAREHPVCPKCNETRIALEEALRAQFAEVSDSYAQCIAFYI